MVEESAVAAAGAVEATAAGAAGAGAEATAAETADPEPGPAVGAQRGRDVIDVVPLGLHLYRLEADDRLIFEGFNPAADRILGVDNAQFVGRELLEAFPALIDTEVPARYRAAAALGVPWRTESLRYEQGRIAGAFDVWAFQVAPGHMGALFSDITERKRTEAALREHREHLEELVEIRTREARLAEEELLRTERLSALGRLIATVGHELRTPLGTLRAALHTIAGAVRQAEVAGLARVVAIAERSIVRCDAIVEELLDYTRQRALHLEATAIDEWLGALLDEAPPVDGVEVVRHLGAGVLVPCDREQLRRAVTNLVLNAVQALGASLLAERRLSVSSAVHGGVVEIAVVDTGPGIPSADLPRVFEPLYTTKPDGVGLGLPLARQIVEQHGGTLFLQSVVGRGTSVFLRLPLLPLPASGEVAPATRG
jgi:signal transduction histidine kinase